MKRKNLFIIFCITALTLSACGKNETPVMSNSVETEVETETITTDEIIAEEVEEPTENVVEEITEEPIEPTETDQTIEVDITGVDGTVEEGDYDEEIHSENTVPTEETDEFQQMLEEMAKEIYNSNGGGYVDYIPVDPEIEAALGVTEGSGNELRNPGAFGSTELPDYLQGDVQFE